MIYARPEYGPLRGLALHHLQPLDKSPPYGPRNDELEVTTLQGLKFIGRERPISNQLFLNCQCPLLIGEQQHTTYNRCKRW